MASLLPSKGRILDGGSGHGLMSLVLAAQCPDRQVQGMDHSANRVHMARQASQGLPNLSFKKGDFRFLPSDSYAGIVLLDVLHYLSYEQQVKLFQDLFRKLRNDGVLLFRDVDRRPGLASLWNRFHEILMTGLGITQAEGLHFRTGSEWERLACKAGFKVRAQSTGRFPFADVLFYCRKR